MVARIPEIQTPELFIGFVSPIGANVQACVEAFRVSLLRLGYKVVELKVTDVFHPVQEFIMAESPLKESPSQDRYRSYIKYGNQLRKEFDDDAVLAALTIGRIYRVRPRLDANSPKFERTAYLVHQFKRKEEIELFRSVYGRLFFQISVYSRRGARVDHLAHSFANSDNSANINHYRSQAEEIIDTDENEADAHGQKVSRVFHDGDLFVNTDVRSPTIEEQIDRFCRLLFGNNSLSPTKTEYGMFVAKAAALRTLDLSRQVGAAVFSPQGEIISIGSNEVPKAGGGTYWSDESRDDREYLRGHDSNDRRKREILSEIASTLGLDSKMLLEKKEVKDSQFMDALEYGRIVHAEMNAITDAARLGRSIRGGVLFCTAFPCHMCAKHIVSAGVDKVVFLEPYPKSLVLDLHSDSIMVEGNDRGKFKDYDGVAFEHFHGISPRRYRELFERGKRKYDDGQFVEWTNKSPRPNLGVSSPFYHEFEQQLFEVVIATYMRAKKMNEDILALRKVKYSDGNSKGTETTRHVAFPDDKEDRKTKDSPATPAHSAGDRRRKSRRADR